MPLCRLCQKLHLNLKPGDLLLNTLEDETWTYLILKILESDYCCDCGKYVSYKVFAINHKYFTYDVVCGFEIYKTDMLIANTSKK